MGKQISVVLSGIGGYGKIYADAARAAKNVRIAGIVDPKPEGYPRWAEMAGEVPVFSSLEEFFQKESADLTVISAPIPFHAPQATLAMEHGSHVLCEKPAAATPQEIRQMMQVSEKTGRFCDIGYQWSHSEAILRLKEIILSGKLGKPVRLRTEAHWPRNAAYYARAGWAGQVYDARGNFILDSVAANATAHYLHNMFFVLGEDIASSAFPVSLQAELYRVNPIATFDTAMVRAQTASGVEILYYASHAVRDNITVPEFHYEFTNGDVVLPEAPGGTNILVRYADGTTEDVGNPYAQQDRKFQWAVKAAAGELEAPPCPPRAALPLTLSVCAMHRSLPRVTPFPQELRRLHKEDFTYVDGLAEIMHDCYAKGVLPSEAGVPWAVAGEKVAVSPLDTFEDPGIQ